MSDSPYKESDLEKEFICLAHNHKSRIHEALCSAKFQLDNREQVIATLKETINILNNDYKEEIRNKDATIARLTAEVERLRQERDDQFWAREHERKELIAARTALEDGYRQGWEHRKQVQDSFNEATIAVSRKFQEDLLEILTIVENDNDPDWSKVQKVKGIMLKHHIEEDEEMYDG